MSCLWLDYRTETWLYSLQADQDDSWFFFIGLPTEPVEVISVPIQGACPLLYFGKFSLFQQRLYLHLKRNILTKRLLIRMKLISFTQQIDSITCMRISKVVCGPRFGDVAQNLDKNVRLWKKLWKEEARHLNYCSNPEFTVISLVTYSIFSSLSLVNG